MSFVPPRCPNTDCTAHADPVVRFYIRIGTYVVRCRPEPVQRFRCRLCGKRFSSQTFRHDYRDRRPECNILLFQLLTAGVGFRQAGRILDLDVHSVQSKMRKIARTCWSLHDNLSPRLPAGHTYLMDEEETYEQASIRPVTMPVLIEGKSWFISPELQRGGSDAWRKLGLHDADARTVTSRNTAHDQTRARPA